MFRQLVFTLALCYGLANGHYTITVELVKYENPDNTVEDGRCCDPQCASISSCTANCKCDLGFEICIEPVQGGSTDIGKCTRTTLYTGEVTTDEGSFTFKRQPYGDFDNPETSDVNTGDWKGFNFKTKVIDYDIGSPDTVDEIVWTFDAETYPAGKWHNITKQHSRDKGGPTTFAFNFNATCFQGYVGPLCKKITTPAPTTQPPTTPAPTTQQTTQGPTQGTSERPTREPTTHGPTREPTTHGPTREPTTHGPSREPTSHGPTQQPTSEEPTREPTSHRPTREPTSEGPTREPTSHRPTREPTSHRPTREPTSEEPTREPTSHRPTREPTSEEPTREPTSHRPTREPTSEEPTREPTSHRPTREPTSEEPTREPTSHRPTREPTSEGPTREPTSHRPTREPTSEEPTREPTSHRPTQEPTSEEPTREPTSHRPTREPTSEEPTREPTSHRPTREPTSEEPTREPTSHRPTRESTSEGPTREPTSHRPTREPTSERPTRKPTSERPTREPTSERPTREPTSERPTREPTSEEPTREPTSERPTRKPTSERPTGEPTSEEPTREPTSERPTWEPTSEEPTKAPTQTSEPTKAPTTTLTSEPTKAPTTTLPPAPNCDTWNERGNTTSGIYKIKIPASGRAIDVYCDMDTDGGPWLLIQRRQDTIDFYETFENYEKGFPNSLSGSFWLGLKNIYELTDQTHKLRIDLWDCHGRRFSQTYDSFKIGSADEHYKLTVSNTSVGEAGDSLNSPDDRFKQNGFTFGTKGDEHCAGPLCKTGINCAQFYKGGFWYNSCGLANLNGKYYKGCYYTSPFQNGILWNTWRSDQYSAARAEMKIRPSKTSQ